VVEAEEGVAGPDAGGLAVAGGGTRFDDDIDVVDAAQELRRDEGDCLAHEAPEVRAFQG
jgi:hypothetical protein